MHSNKIYVPELEASATFEIWQRRREQLYQEMKDAEEKYLSERREKLVKLNAIANACAIARIDAL